ncbi:MAG: type II toxin-antitoxin system RelE/ParE family toxin [SAR324 cluster bacterium]|nr:type II toxin-antitoxin system RelE/ParE family toxin [SAR324 cluster bacterium]
MIESFQCKETKKIWNKQRSKKFPQNIQQRVLEKMQRIDSAERVEDFYFPPSNQFEALTGNRKGQYSVRVNQQWRLCFNFDGNIQNLELVDYH